MNINESDISYYTKCECGAVTVNIGKETYSVKQSHLKEFFPDVDLRHLKAVKGDETFCCNHCVNKWGLDLCACGSGEAVDKCDNKLDECGKPMQLLGEYTHVAAQGGWIR